MIDVRDLFKRFHAPTRGDVVAVNRLCFSVQPGEIYGLLGPNGAGKTTTLRLLATLLRPDSGSIGIAGVDALATPVRARSLLAYVPAEAGLPSQLSPREVVRLFAAIQGVEAPRRRSEELLDRLGAAAYMDTPCADLSTGMKRRVVLARALVHEPQVLLLDEPTDGLDVVGRRDVLALIREQASVGRAVVLSSHILSEIERVVDRVGVMVQGELVVEGDLESVRKQTGKDDLDDAFILLVGGNRK